MELKRAFGQALKELRASKGLSREAVGASQSYISDLERGVKSPTVEKLVELAANMGVHPLTISPEATWSQALHRPLTS